MPVTLLNLEEIPLSSSAVYKKMDKGVFPRPIHLKGRSLWLKDEVDAWFNPEKTVKEILECRSLLQDGFTEAEMRGRGWKRLRNQGYNERALKILVEEGILERRKLQTGGRPRVEYRWCA
jgi:predicted DNA-binding transcriptional regulator AlpA